jgi:glycosyltransferase involved in cell wall biosynthesis
MAGAMQPIYGVDVLLGALERIRRTYPEVGAIIIAYKSEDPAYREEIDGLVASLSLERAVLFPQYLPDVSAVVAQADVSVRPCHQDGDSMAVREALALGVPVVASRVGFRPEGTVLFEPGDSADLAEKLLKVFSGPPEPLPSNVNQESDPIDAYSDLYHSVFNTR